MKSLPPDATHETVRDALIAAHLFAASPAPLGGLAIRAHAGPVRDVYLEWIRSQLAPSQTFRKLPLSIQDDRLIGGLDLAATLHSGKPVLHPGLLSEMHGGVLAVPMAERMPPGLAARLASAMDLGRVTIQRDGISDETPVSFGLLLLDESVADDEHLPPELLDRIAFRVDLTSIPLSVMRQAVQEFPEILSDLALSHAAPDEGPVQVIDALCSTALALGIDSLRASMMAARVAHRIALQLGRSEASLLDAALAARLVLSPRATRLPVSAEANQDPADSDASSPENNADDAANAPESEDVPNDAASDASEDAAPPTQLPDDMDELVLEAAKAAIPAGLLSQLLADQGRIAKGSSSGKSGALKKGGHRGRPMGSRSGIPGGHQRLSVMDTLRAAAPWQRVRQAASANQAGHVGHHVSLSRLIIRAEDFRIKRFKERSETTTIFAIDASGSAALHRLAEAKGAIELLLADCYVRRDQVAVIAFRGRQAEVILPPTRSLVRAKRGLAGLPGGGGTPLSLAIDACRDLAASVVRKGETPLVVMLTDGKANITRDGQTGRELAQQEAREAAHALAMLGVGAMVIDTSPQSSDLARELAAEMRARYMLLPHAAATELSQAVRTMSVR
jgi:magnesium chelatase subunit D